MSAAETRARIAAADRLHYAKPKRKPSPSLLEFLRSVHARMAAEDL